MTLAMPLATGRHPLLFSACILLGWSLAAAEASAQANEGPYVTASYLLQYDSNLFRLPAHVDPRPVIGRDSTSEFLHVQSVGVGYEKSFSLQRLRATASLTSYRYQHFSRYDLVAKNYSLSWNWAYTPELHGRIYLEREESASNFDDAQNRTDNNGRLRKRQGLDVKYGLDGPWQLQAGLRQSRDSTNIDQFGEDSYRQNSIEAGLQRRLGTGNRVGTRWRHSNGRTLDNPLSQDDYRQDELLLDLHWVLSGKTTANGNLSLIERSHPSRPDTDFSGHNASLNVNWRATGKTVLTLNGSTAIASNQTRTSTHARNDRLSLTGTWHPGSLTTVGVSLGETHRRLLGNPAGRATDPRRDRTSDASLFLSWNFQRNFSLQTRLQHSQRRSSQPGAGFSSTQVSVGLNARL